MAISFHYGYGLIKITFTFHYLPRVSKRAEFGDYRHFLILHTKKSWCSEESSSGEINSHPMSTGIPPQHVKSDCTAPQRCVVSTHE